MGSVSWLLLRVGPSTCLCGGVRLDNNFVSSVSFKTFYCYMYIVSMLEAIWDLENNIPNPNTEM